MIPVSPAHNPAEVEAVARVLCRKSARALSAFTNRFHLHPTDAEVTDDHWREHTGQAAEILDAIAPFQRRREDAAAARAAHQAARNVIALGRCLQAIAAQMDARAADNSPGDEWTGTLG